MKQIYLDNEPTPFYITENGAQEAFIGEKQKKMIMYKVQRLLYIR